MEHAKCQENEETKTKEAFQVNRLSISRAVCCVMKGVTTWADNTGVRMRYIIRVTIVKMLVKLKVKTGPRVAEVCNLNDLPLSHILFQHISSQDKCLTI